MTTLTRSNWFKEALTSLKTSSPTLIFGISSINLTKAPKVSIHSLLASFNLLRIIASICHDANLWVGWGIEGEKEGGEVGTPKSWNNCCSKCRKGILNSSVIIWLSPSSELDTFKLGLNIAIPPHWGVMKALESDIDPLDCLIFNGRFFGDGT